MNTLVADGTNTTTRKIIFGRDSESEPLEWYVLGKDAGVAGDNIAIFAADDIMRAPEFGSFSNKTYESSFGLYETSPSEVYPNHYGASNLRVELQALAKNQEYFTTSEQSFMQATDIKTNDVKNNAVYFPPNYNLPT